MTRARQRLGRRGEGRAARYLRGQGLRLVQRNWRDRSGDEIDLVMRDPKTDLAVLVEVRTQDGRARGFAGAPELTIGPEKSRRIRRAAERWMLASTWRPRGVRIDVVALVYRGWFRWQIRWFPNVLAS
ncbi:MAG: YraN family protein [Myxococcota bacterium]